MSHFQNITHNITLERIQHLYVNAPTAFIGLLAGYFGIYFSIKELVPTHYLNIWSLVFFSLLACRAYIIYSYNKASSHHQFTPKTALKYEKYLILMSALNALTYSATLFFPFQEDALIAFLMITIVFMGMAAGSTISSNASKPVVFSYLLITSLPLIYFAFQSPLPYTNIIGFIYLAFFSVLIKLTLNGNKILIENIDLHLQSKAHSLSDSLTKLGNRRQLAQLMDKLIPASINTNSPFALVLFDIDHFKRYNDSHGHLQGDKILVDVANLLQNSVRATDKVIRFGGEELLILLPNTQASEAKGIVLNILKQVEQKTPVTLSAGLSMNKGLENYKEIIKLADDALYKAKKNGRNQLVCAA